MKNSLLKSKKILAIFSVVFFILILSNHISNLHLLKSSIKDLELQAIKSASANVSLWLESKIHSLASINKILTEKGVQKKELRYKDILNNGAEISGFNQVFLTNITEVEKSKYVNRISETIEKNMVTVFLPYKETNAYTDIVFICMPTIVGNSIEENVLCGTISLDKIKSKILDIPLPNDGVMFVTDENHKVIIHEDNLELQNRFEPPKSSSNILINSEHYLEDYIYSYAKLEYPKWNIILKLNKTKMYEKVNYQLFINFSIYLLSLIVFFFLNIFFSKIYNRNEKKLLEAKQLIQSFIDFNEKGYLVIDMNHNITYCNKKFLRILNLKEHYMHNASLSAEFASFQNAHLSFEFSLFKNTHFLSGFSLFQSLQAWRYDSIFKMLDVTQKKLKTWETTFSYNYKNEIVHVLCTISPILDESDNYKGVALILADITKEELQKKKDKEHKDLLVQQSKMADLGEMIGAVSHQWRQPLNATSIMLSNLLQFKNMGCLNDDIFEENINNIMTNIDYLSETIDTFHDFYKVQKSPQDFELKRTIEELRLIIEPYCKNTGIIITTTGKEESYKCLNYKNEFQQIIEVLIINAKEALLETPELEEKIINLDIQEEEVDYVIEVKDNGMGIPKNIQSELFRPFITSKGKKGTGSGLYLSRLIARERLEGDLTVVSYRDPTIFSLRIKKRIEEDND